MADVKLYLCDWKDVIPKLSAGLVDAVITDPPYGIAVATNYKARKRGALAQCNDFVPVHGDDMPFDPSPFLGFKTVVLFGANHYAGRLPRGAWHVWDKLDGLQSGREVGFNDNSDCEFIWSNTGNAARIFRHRWMGAMKGSEHAERRVHPTQKPIALMRQLIEYFTREGDTIFDPFMGSGATGVACMQTGRNFIGSEIYEPYFSIAKARIEKAQAAIQLPMSCM